MDDERHSNSIFEPIVEHQGLQQGSNVRLMPTGHPPALSQSWVSAVAMALAVVSLSLTFFVTNVVMSEDDRSSIDDVESDGEPDDVDRLDDWSVFYASTTDDLPSCGSNRIGLLYYVSSTSSFHVCTISGWLIVDLTGPQGEQGLPGVDGEDGADGVNGTDGIHGTNGTDALQLLATGAWNATFVDENSELSAYIEHCPNGGMVFSVGLDYDGDGVLGFGEYYSSPGSVMLGVCYGADGVNGTDGIDGTDGVDGVDGVNGTNGSASASTMLTKIVPSAPSLDCTMFGRTYVYGLDSGMNGGIAQNGVLEDGEVTHSTTFCHRLMIEQIADHRPGANSAASSGIKSLMIGTTVYYYTTLDCSGTYCYYISAYNFSNLTTWTVANLTGVSSFGRMIDVENSIVTAFGSKVLKINTTTGEIETIFHGYNVESIQYHDNHLYFLGGNSSLFEPGTHVLAHNLTNETTWRLSSALPIDFYRGYYTNPSGQVFSLLIVHENSIYAVNNTGEMYAVGIANNTSWHVGNSSMHPYLLTSKGDLLIVQTGSWTGWGRQTLEIDLHNISNGTTWSLNLSTWNELSHYQGSCAPLFDGDVMYFKGDTNLHYTNDPDVIHVVNLTTGALGSIILNDGNKLHLNEIVGIFDQNMFFTGVPHGWTSSDRFLYAYDFVNETIWAVSPLYGNSTLNAIGYASDGIQFGDSMFVRGTFNNDGMEPWILTIERDIYHT